MSLSTKQDIWLTLAREKYPTLTEDQAQALSLKAASEWYLGGDAELVQLFDQYVMIKNLKDL
jgi:hypothetical protein